MRVRLEEEQIQVLACGSFLIFCSQRVTVSRTMREQLQDFDRETAAAYIVPDRSNRREPGFRIEIGLREWS